MQLNPARKPAVVRAAAVLLAAALALQPGCGTVPSVTETRHQPGLGRVAVIAAGEKPEVRFEGVAANKAEGAAKGAGAALAECVAGLGRGTCSGAACGAAAILLLGICGVVSIVGGVAGAVATPGADQALAARNSLTAAFDTDIQQALRDHVLAAALLTGAQLALPEPSNAEEAARARDYRPLAAQGVDTILEVALTRAGMAGPGAPGSPVGLLMEARVRLLRASDNGELFSAGYTHLGERLQLSEWSANRAERLLRALNAGYESLGRHISDSVLLLYPFPDRGAQSAGTLAAAFGLAPIDPPTRGQLSGDRIIGNRFEWTEVSRTMPTLRWQGFPRPSDVQKAPDEMGRVRSVRYDLVIAREHNLAPAEVVYRREGLPQSTHALESPLSPGARYFWAVRARFELDGRERVTEWSSTHFAFREQVTAPSAFSYRFRTP